MKTSETISAERQYNTKLGLILFMIYLLLYLGFVIGNAFMADMMETKVLFGLNLAIVYGFTLIKMAFVLSMIYGWMCRTEPSTGSEGAATQADQGSSGTTDGQNDGASKAAADSEEASEEGNQ